MLDESNRSTDQNLTSQSCSSSRVIPVTLLQMVDDGRRATPTADSTINRAEGQALLLVNDLRAPRWRRSPSSATISRAPIHHRRLVERLHGHVEPRLQLARQHERQDDRLRPHTTNGATVTLNVDGLGAKPLRSAPSAELLAGVLVQGTPYVPTYYNATRSGSCTAATATLTTCRSAACWNSRAPPRPNRAPCCRSARRSRAPPMRRILPWSAPPTAPATARPVQRHRQARPRLGRQG